MALDRLEYLCIFYFAWTGLDDISSLWRLAISSLGYSTIDTAGVGELSGEMRVGKWVQISSSSFQDKKYIEQITFATTGSTIHYH
ncbi:hypothetical protein SLA2020_051710 [Shorea laevis]